MCFDVPWKTDRSCFSAQQMHASYDTLNVFSYYRKFLSFYEKPYDNDIHQLCIQAALCHLNNKSIFETVYRSSLILPDITDRRHKAVCYLASRFTLMHEKLKAQVRAEEEEGSFNYFETKAFQVQQQKKIRKRIIAFLVDQHRSSVVVEHNYDFSCSQSCAS